MDTAATRNHKPGLMLARKWEGSAIRGWWLSEKLDGVRTYWDGEKLLSRNGNVFHAPSWFTSGLPDMPLDGELWAGRGRFSLAVGTARQHTQSDDWGDLIYLVFDAPTAEGPFEKRLQSARESLAAHRPPFAAVLRQRTCRGEVDLLAELARVDAGGGEGIMLREPGSLHKAGRSGRLLKVKSRYLG